MSFKGFQKSLTRAPQQFKAKFNIGEHSKDAVYIDAERRFQELETETKKLHDESKKYFDAINGMLNHQIEFSKAMTEIYKPISGRVSDPDSMRIEGNPEGINACEEYEAIVKELQETLSPELDMIEARVIRPANELLDVIQVIRKTALKREHKKLDYDRHRAALKKLQDKKERTAKDEKALWKAEGDVEQATQDFDYFNDLLKDELPKLFVLEREFIQPLFQSFYYMQLNIFYTLHERMQRCDIGYFDLTREIEEAFHEKRGEIKDQAESLSICRFKTTGRPRPVRYGARPALEGGKQPALLTAGPSSTGSSASKTSAYSRPPADADAAAPPPYSAATRPPVTSPGLKPALTSPGLKPALTSPGLKPALTSPGLKPALTSPGLKPAASAAAAAAAAKAKPPPPKPKPKALMAAPVPAAETVTALYDYSAQAEGDLSFRAGDVIEIVQRTQNENEWWTGRLRDKEGQFPGNYVQLNQ